MENGLFGVDSRGFHPRALVWCCLALFGSRGWCFAPGEWTLVSREVRLGRAFSFQSRGRVGGAAMGGGGLRKPDFGEFWRSGALGGHPGTGSGSRKDRRVREGVQVFVEVRHGLGVARRHSRRRARPRSRRRRPRYFTLARSSGREGVPRAG